MAFSDGGLIPKVIEYILGMEEGEGKLKLRGQSSLIAFVGDENEVYLAKGSRNVVGVFTLYMPHFKFVIIRWTQVAQARSMLMNRNSHYSEFCLDYLVS